MPIGRFIQKIHCQDRAVISRPPTRGPTACAPQQVAIHAPIAVSRSRPLNDTATIASADGRIAAAPTPSMTRPMISIVGSCASPATTEPTRISSVPIAKTNRRPKMSPSLPPTMIREPARK